jgi:TPP-dependent pyruvate/acetoin dehydrogenase alpha subunit
MEALEAEVKEEIEDAYTFAEEAPDPEPDELYKDVYADEGGGKREEGGTGRR